MADTKISALTAVAAAVAAQELAVNDAGVSKKVTLSQVSTYANANENPHIVRQRSPNSATYLSTASDWSASTYLTAGVYSVIDGSGWHASTPGSVFPTLWAYGTLTVLRDWDRIVQTYISNKGELAIRSTYDAGTWEPWTNLPTLSAADARYVRLTTAQTIAGVKTFSDGLWDGANRAYSDSNPPETLMMTDFPEASVATPAAGLSTMFSTDGKSLRVRDNDGTVTTYHSTANAAAAAALGTMKIPVDDGGVAKYVTTDQNGTYFKSRNAVNNASVTTPAAGFAADTYLVGSSCAVPTTTGLGSLIAKSQYRLKFSVSKTAAGVVAPTINIRVGTAGTTADASRCLLTFAAQTAVIDEGLFEVFATFRTVGSGTTAVIQGVGTLIHRLSITGLSTSVGGTIVSTGGGFDSTVANLIVGASVNGGTSAAWTIALVQAELYNLA